MPFYEKRRRRVDNAALVDLIKPLYIRRYGSRAAFAQVLAARIGVCPAWYTMRLRNLTRGYTRIRLREATTISDLLDLDAASLIAVAEVVNDRDQRRGVEVDIPA